MASPSPWLKWMPGRELLLDDMHNATKPSKPDNEPRLKSGATSSEGFEGFVPECRAEIGLADRSPWLDWQPHDSQQFRMQPSCTAPSKPTGPDSDGVRVVDGSEGFVPESVVAGGLATAPGELEYQPAVHRNQDLCVSTKPTKPSKPANGSDSFSADGGFVGSVGFVDESSGENGVEAPWDTAAPPLRPAVIDANPTWGKTVDISSGGFSGKLTVARHHSHGVNRFGQSAVEFPFCALNYAAWQDCHFDLKDAHWYRTEGDAASLRRDGLDASHCQTPGSGLKGKQYSCVCGTTPVILVKDGGRWLMFTGSTAAKNRRRDFASPHLEHAMRTAEYWLGLPASPWREEPG